MDVAWILFLVNLLVEGKKWSCWHAYWWASVCANLYSDEESDQIEYAIFTREIYDFCDITSGGFCTGVCSIEV